MPHTESLARFNELNKPALLRLLITVCQAPNWRNAIVDHRPYPDLQALLDLSDESLSRVHDIEIEETVVNHPRIGSKNAGPRSSREQSRFADTLDDATFQEFFELNKRYEQKFGYLFLVAASGRSAKELLDVLKERLANDPDVERQVMRGQLALINRIRLTELVTEDLATVTGDSLQP